jgi:uncharacterized protein (DUF305 family)
MLTQDRSDRKHGAALGRARISQMIALLALVSAAACSGGAREEVDMIELSLRDGNSTGDTCGWESWKAVKSVVGDRRIPYTPANDRAFIEFFVEHHGMAVMMAEHELMHGENAELKKLAQEIVDMQTAEIEKMQAIAAQLSEPAPPAMPADPHSDADMERMSSLGGSALDAMFLTDMIGHHAAGLPVAHRSIATLQNEELRTLAEEMTKAQAREIGEMQTWREQLAIQGAGEDLAPAERERADMGLRGDRRIPLTPANDIEFIDFFVPHHVMAIEMAEQVVARGQDPEVRAMAEEARDSQRAEVEKMRAVRESMTGAAESPAPPRDRHMQPEMAEMMTLNGLELDRMFLREMTPHHAAGIPTAHRAKPHVQNEELRAMADNIFEAQSREIGEMQQTLDNLPAQ